MFAEIKEYRTRGFNKSQVARLLDIDYKTVTKYWDMAPDEFAGLRQNLNLEKRRWMNIRMRF